MDTHSSASRIAFIKKESVEFKVDPVVVDNNRFVIAYNNGVIEQHLIQNDFFHVENRFYTYTNKINSPPNYDPTSNILALLAKRNDENNDRLYFLDKGLGYKNIKLGLPLGNESGSLLSKDAFFKINKNGTGTFYSKTNLSEIRTIDFGSKINAPPAIANGIMVYDVFGNLHLFYGVI